MATSTPPAWAWLEEKYVPVTTDPGYYPADVDEMCHEYGQMREEALSEDPRIPSNAATARAQNDSESPAGSRKTPDSATLRERNGGDPTGTDIWPLERAASATASGAVCADQCPDCRCAPNMPHSPDCDYLRYGPMSECDCTAQMTESVINAVPPHPGCPVSQTGNAPDTGIIADTFSVPFAVQEFMFEELCEEKLAELPHLIFTHSERIIEMARDRFRQGYAKYGSAMYSWTPERRLDETLCELADAVVYLTSGPLE